MRVLILAALISSSVSVHGAGRCEDFLRGRAPFYFAVAASLAAHAGLIYVLALEPSQPLGGGGKNPEIAIEVELVPFAALESRKSVAEIPSGDPVPLESQDGMPTAADPVAPAPAVTEEKMAPPEIPEDAPAPEPEVRPPQEPKVSQPETGGASVRATPQKETKAGAVKASPGAMQAYAREIVKALAKTKPKAARTKGTAVVVFAVAEDGTLALSRIEQTSGSARLDAAALRALRAARFPPPPRGMNETQRTYKIPYTFR